MIWLNILIAMAIFVGGCISIAVFAMTLDITITAIKSVFARKHCDNFTAVKLSEDEFKEIMRILESEDDD